MTIQPVQFAYLVAAPALTLLSIDKATNLLFRKTLGEGAPPPWLMRLDSSLGLCLVGVSILCLGIPVYMVQGIVVRHVPLSRELLLFKFLWVVVHVAAYTFYKIGKIDAYFTRERESERPSRMARTLEEREALIKYSLKKFAE